MSQKTVFLSHRRDPLGRTSSKLLQQSPNLAMRLSEQSARCGIDPEWLVLLAVEDHLQRVSPIAASHDEARLLREINQGFPEAVWLRYRELKTKRDARTLSDPKQQELRQLTNDIKLRNARRLEQVMELARLRRQPLDDVLDELGIRDPGYV